MRKEVILTTCVYCEASIDDILAKGEAKTADEALQFVVINGSQVLLCPNCRKTHAAYIDEDIDKLLNDPITFPPGVTAVEHCCPELEFQGKSEIEATFVLKMVREGDYYSATCPHCNVTVRSLAEDDEI